MFQRQSTFQPQESDILSAIDERFEELEETIILASLVPQLPGVGVFFAIICFICLNYLVFLGGLRESTGMGKMVCFRCVLLVILVPVPENQASSRLHERIHVLEEKLKIHSSPLNEAGGSKWKALKNQMTDPPIGPKWGPEDVSPQRIVPPDDEVNGEELENNTNVKVGVLVLRIR